MAFLAATRLDHQVIPRDEDSSSTWVDVHYESRDDEQRHELVSLGEWKPSQVKAWLVSLGRPAIGEAALKREVDGSTLIYLDTSAWQELGVESAIERAKLIAAVKKASIGGKVEHHEHHQDDDHNIGRQNPYDDEAMKQAKEAADFFTGTWSPLKPFQLSRTFESGAEHRLDWALCIANGCSNPSDVKQHTLRFLGMYNVIDLLVLTIDFTYVITIGLTDTSIETVIDAIILTMMSVSTVMATMGMIGSTILYNTTSGVSDANFIVFAKLPSTLEWIKVTNDTSIWSGIFVGFSTFAWMYKICVQNGEVPFKDRWQYSIIPMVVVTVTFLILMNLTMGFCVPSATNLAMFGGLFNSEPIAPLKEDPTWAHRSTPKEIVEYVSGVAKITGKAIEHNECGPDCADEYARETVAHMHGKVVEEVHGATALSHALSSVFDPTAMATLSANRSKPLTKKPAMKTPFGVAE
jgi:hypothetical protein